MENQIREMTQRLEKLEERDVERDKQDLVRDGQLPECAEVKGELRQTDKRRYKMCVGNMLRALIKKVYLDQGEKVPVGHGNDHEMSSSRYENATQVIVKAKTKYLNPHSLEDYLVDLKKYGEGGY
ncbi:MAG: hypothetical protein M1823_002836 [Watsoniomyces obsoletus]|nr:MAG: hypothetical protein M1823_002836 [Watsoniomyces obsoletus]